MNEKVYMHSINSKDYNYFNSREEIKILGKILSCGYILSLRGQGKLFLPCGFNGYDYISLCDYEKRNLHPEGRITYNSYQSYIKYGIALAFDKNSIDAIEPIVLNVISDVRKNNKRINDLSNGIIRYTDLPDEVQVKDSISLEKLEYITYPVSKYFDNQIFFNNNKKIKRLKNEIDEIRSLLDYYNFNNIPIYDIDSQIELNDEGIEKLVLRK